MTRPTILVTQAEGASGSLAAHLRARGADVVAVPAIAILPPEDSAPLEAALAAIGDFDWIVFTSRHAVDAVLASRAWDAARSRALPKLRVAAVGRATARRLAEEGVTADLVPDNAGAAELGRWLAEAGAPRTRVLWPRSDIALQDMPTSLRRAGLEVIDPVAYRTVSGGGPGSPAPASGMGPSGTELEGPALRRRLEENSIDAVAFMSPSSVRGLSALLESDDLGFLSRCAVIASIGPTTSAELRVRGAAPSVESGAHTAEDLAETIVRYLEAHSPDGGSR